MRRRRGERGLPRPRRRPDGRAGHAQGPQRHRPLPDRLPLHPRRAGPVHGHLAEADGRGLGRADPVPRARRRQPGADGLEHAAPGGAAAGGRAADRRHRPGAGGRDELGHDRQGAAGRHRHLRRLDPGDPRPQPHLQAPQVRRAERADLPEPEADRRGRPEGQEGRHPGRRRLDLQGRAGAGPQRPGRVHGLGRLQLRGRDHHQRAAGEGGRLHLDPHRGVRDRDPRDQAGARGVHPRHPQRLGEGAAEPRRERHRPDRHLRQAGRHPGRQGGAEVQERADARGEAAARDLRPGRRGRQERLAGGPLGRRGDRHQHPAVQPADEPQRGRAQGVREGAEGHRAGRERQDRRRVQADDQGAGGGRRRPGARPVDGQAAGPRPATPRRWPTRASGSSSRRSTSAAPSSAPRRARSIASMPPGSRRCGTRRSGGSTA